MKKLLIVFLLTWTAVQAFAEDWYTLSSSTRNTVRERMLDDAGVSHLSSSFLRNQGCDSLYALLPEEEWELLTDSAFEQRLSCLKIDFSPLLADIRKAEDRFLASCTTGFTTDIFGRVIARDPQSVEAEVKVFTECLEESASSVLEAWDAESSAFLAEVSDEYLAQGLPFERLSLPLSTIRAGVKRECERLISQSARGLLSLGISGASSDGGVFPSQVSSVQNEYPAIAGTDKFLFESPADILSATDPLCDDFSERFEEGMTAWNDAYL